jgi:hypothetical protein
MAIGDHTVRSSRWPVDDGAWLYGFAVYREVAAEVPGATRAWKQVSRICATEEELAEELARLGVTTWEDLRR